MSRSEQLSKMSIDEKIESLTGQTGDVYALKSILQELTEKIEKLTETLGQHNCLKRVT